MSTEDASSEAALRHLAARQHGVVTRHQLRSVDASRGRIHHLVSTGRWRMPRSGVLVVAGAPETELQNAFIAVAEAGPGAALSHSSAAWLWGLPTFRLFPLHVLVERGAKDPRTMQLATLHTSRVLPPSHVVEHLGIRVTSPVRTLFDLSGVLTLGRLARALDDAWGARLVRADPLFGCLDQLRGRGRGRVATMRLLLEERGTDYVPPESNLERRFRRLLTDDGQKPMDYQVELGGVERIARVDAVDRGAMLVVQIDGDRHHTALLDVQRDQRQDAALRSLGWTVLRVLENDLWHNPERVVAEVRDARAAGRAALRKVS
jgi:very-short-patch-repair endonuclease